MLILSKNTVSVNIKQIFEQISIRIKLNGL